MSDVVFGNPWHGRLTPSGLVLADATVKTAMAGNNAAGAAVSISYKYPGDTATGNTYYVKTPGQPVPVTTPLLSAIGGEFKNDAIFFGTGKRYSPFSTKSMLGTNDWLHYGSDGKWRKLRLEIVSTGLTSHVVRISRRGEFAQIGKPTVTENTTIAEFTLEHTAPVSFNSATFPALDASRDGRSIVVTRWDYWSATISTLKSQDKWVSDTHQSIVAAWRIDIADDAGSATFTKVWQVAVAENTVTPLPDSSYWATGPVFVVRNGTGPVYSWQFYEPYAGTRYSSYGEEFYTTRLVGCAWAPDGTLQLIEWRYEHNFAPRYSHVTGVVARGGAASETEPPLPATSFPRTELPYPSPDYPSTTESDWTEFYEITVYANTTLLHTMDPDDDWPVWSERMTNNVFHLRSDAVSVGRFGPGAADVSAVALSPLYASYNPRSNTVVSSTTPIGFV